MTAVCEKFGHKVSYEYAICGADAIDKVGDPFPEETYQVCKQADAVLFSAVGDPKFDNDPTAKVRPEQGLLAMRKKLGLFANIRPVQTFKCLVHKSPLKAELVDGADFLCIRELTGGMYFGEKYQDNDKAYDTNMYTRPEIERILKVGFEYAMKRRKHLTVVDKANVLASSRLWRQIAQEMAPQYPEVTTDYMFVDNAAMKMIQEPKFFDVMVTENTFGDILTDEGSVISGSMGLLPSASTGESTPVFEPIHGSWPQAKGLNIANPLAQILSVAMLFEYFDCKEEGALIRRAVDASLDANVRTPEIQVEGGAKYGTKEVTTDYMFVDNAAMKMIQEPKFFDVMVTENTFGDILTDEGSVISGSMGLLPSASTGESTPVFEPIHGSWPQAKGLNIANPLAQILSVAMLFEYFDCKEEGALIRRAVDASLDANVRTPEIQVEGGAKYGTKEVGAWIVDYIRKA